MENYTHLPSNLSSQNSFQNKTPFRNRDKIQKELITATVAERPEVKSNLETYKEKVQADIEKKHVDEYHFIGTKNNRIYVRDIKNDITIMADLDDPDAYGLKVAMGGVIALGIIFLGGLFFQGCKDGGSKENEDGDNGGPVEEGTTVDPVSSTEIPAIENTTANDPEKIEIVSFEDGQVINPDDLEVSGEIVSYTPNVVLSGVTDSTAIAIEVNVDNEDKPEIFYPEVTTNSANDQQLTSIPIEIPDSKVAETDSEKIIIRIAVTESNDSETVLKETTIIINSEVPVIIPEKSNPASINPGESNGIIVYVEKGAEVTVEVEDSVKKAARKKPGPNNLYHQFVSSVVTAVLYSELSNDKYDVYMISISAEEFCSSQIVSIRIKAVKNNKESLCIIPVLITTEVEGIAKEGNEAGADTGAGQVGRAETAGTGTAAEIAETAETVNIENVDLVVEDEEREELFWKVTKELQEVNAGGLYTNQKINFEHIYNYWRNINDQNRLQNSILCAYYLSNNINIQQAENAITYQKRVDEITTKEEMLDMLDKVRIDTLSWTNMQAQTERAASSRAQRESLMQTGREVLKLLEGRHIPNLTTPPDIVWIDALKKSKGIEAAYICAARMKNEYEINSANNRKEALGELERIAPFSVPENTIRNYEQFAQNMDREMLFWQLFELSYSQVFISLLETRVPESAQSANIASAYMNTIRIDNSRTEYYQSVKDRVLDMLNGVPQECVPQNVLEYINTDDSNMDPQLLMLMLRRADIANDLSAINLSGFQINNYNYQYYVLGDVILNYYETNPESPNLDINYEELYNDWQASGQSPQEYVSFEIVAEQNRIRMAVLQTVKALNITLCNTDDTSYFAMYKALANLFKDKLPPISEAVSDSAIYEIYEANGNEIQSAYVGAFLLANMGTAEAPGYCYQGRML
ncbi:MAG: hypothetical protein ABIH39_01790, partial [Candidatus Margulisiibacteriota bacterium]